MTKTMTKSERGKNWQLLWPLVTTVIGVGFLLTLGTWQVQRLAEKNALIKNIEARSAAPVVPLPAGAIDPAEWEYRRVSVVGTFLHDQEIHLSAIGANGRPGYRVITPLTRSEGLPLLVNRGWVPQALKEPATRSSGPPAGIVHLEGQIAGARPKSRFAPPDDLPGNVWYYVDLEEMALAVGMSDHMPVMVVASASPNPGDYPRVSQVIRMPSNNHLVYAITWFILALGLAGVFLLYWHQQRG